MPLGPTQGVIRLEQHSGTGWHQHARQQQQQQVVAPFVRRTLRIAIDRAASRQGTGPILGALGCQKHTWMAQACSARGCTMCVEQQVKGFTLPAWAISSVKSWSRRTLSSSVCSPGVPCVSQEAVATRGESQTRCIWQLLQAAVAAYQLDQQSLLQHWYSIRKNHHHSIRSSLSSSSQLDESTPS